MRKASVVSLAAMLLCAAAASRVGAQVPVQEFRAGKSNLKAGPVRVHPFLYVMEIYDDNVFLTPTATRDDFITVVSPGVLFQLPFGRQEIDVGYRADIIEYADLDESNIRHTGRVQGKGSYPGGLSWAAFDEVKRTNDRPDTEQEPLIGRIQNDANLEVEYAFADRWSVAVGYANTVYDYDSGTFQNPGQPPADFDVTLSRMEQLATADAYYRVLPKTALLVEYGYGTTNYFNDGTAAVRDNEIHQGQVGVRGDITSKMNALVKVGYGTKQFDNPTQKDFTGLIASGRLAFQPTDRTLLTVLVDRSAPESSFRAIGGPDDFYVNEGAVLRLDQVLGHAGKIRVFAESGISNHDYQTSSRNDDVYAAGAGVHYQIRDYLGVSGEYLFERRDSNTAAFDYTNNRVVLRVLLTM